MNRHAASNPPSARRGFTLIEMLVVLGLIVGLMALLLPAILKAREAGRSTQCQSNLHQLHLGFTQYTDANKHYVPYRIEDPAVFNKWGVQRPRWQWLLSELLGRPVQNPDALLAAGTADRTYTDVPLDNEIFFDPTIPDQTSIRNGAYGYNFQYLGNSRNLVDGDLTTPMLNYPVRAAADQGRTIAFGDSRGGNSPHGGHSMTLDPPHMRKRPDGKTVDSPSPSRIAGFDPYGPDETGTDIQIYFSPAEARHNGLANVVFIDGHIVGMSLEDLGYVMVNNVAQPQAGPLPWGDNRLWTGEGRDETSPNFGR